MEWHILGAEENLTRKIREPDLTKLRDLPRGEAMRIAMILYGWDAATAAMKVDVEQGRYSVEAIEPYKRQGA